MKIIIDPRSNYSYCSFYIKGLMDVYGQNNISYSMSPFKGLGDLGNDIRFIIKNEEKETKIFCHLNDSYQISEQDYKWCDVYGCVNTNYKHYPKDEYPKLVSLAPSFGIQCDKRLINVISSSIACLLKIFPYVWNRTKWNKYTHRPECNHVRNIKQFLSYRYKVWRDRLPLSAYSNDVISNDNYVFFLSTLWQSDEWNKNDEGVNLRRAHFIRACKSIQDCLFEGGLLGDDTSSNEKFADVVTMRRVAFPDWIEKTKRSALVFNTPAFWDCHGWKLGEYLALGKCIISTKLSNDLPYPLEHGKNIHFVEDSEETMRKAIEYILAHPDYRHKLERGAKEYWDKYGTPEASLRLLGIDSVKCNV